MSSGAARRPFSARRRTSRRHVKKSSIAGLYSRVLRIEPLEDRRMLTILPLVNSLDDNTSVDGKITLREAVYAANTDSQVGDCPGGSGADTIQFDPSLFTTPPPLPRILPLSSGNPLVVSEDLNIIGPGSDQLTIDALGIRRHFEVNDATDVTLTLSGITLQNGNAGEEDNGGSIYCDGSLSLADITLTGNAAGQDGGAIYVSNAAGSLVLDDCLFDQNRAFGGYGGGVYSNAPATITGGRFDGNIAETGGGGICINAPLTLQAGTVFDSNHAEIYGGAISASRTVDSWNTQFTGNSADLGGAVHIQQNHLADFHDATFTDNHADTDGGAIYMTGDRPCEVRDSTFTRNDAESSGGAVFVVTGSLTSAGSTYNDNRALFGGAIAGGGGLSSSNDEFLGNTADMDGGAISAWGQTTVNAGQFMGNQARHGGAINQTGNPLTIGRSEFLDNHATGDGGAVRSNSQTIILNSTFRDNDANRGGAIVTWNDDYTTLIQGCLIELNEAWAHGGAIWSDQRRVEVDASTVRANTAANDGGGVYANLGLVAVTDSLIAGNTATDKRGGGLFMNTTAELTVANSTISGNRADDGGGGVYFSNTTNAATLVHATVADNHVVASGTGDALGGGIYAPATSVLVQNSIIAGNDRDAGTTPDEFAGTADPASSYNLVQDAATAGGLVSGVNNNLVGVDPLLGPLQHNGGQSHTHALLTGSPAIDTANNGLALAPDGEPLWYDQRGYEFDRLVGLHVDRGAFEAQVPGAEIHGRKEFDLDGDAFLDQPSADGNCDGRVDAADYTVWRDNLGLVAGDYDGNGSLDEADYASWKSSFGQTVTPGTGADGNGDGTVDAADYTYWRDCFEGLGGSLGIAGDYDRDGVVDDDDYRVWTTQYGHQEDDWWGGSIVVNGGFEDGDLSGTWAYVGAGSNAIRDWQAYGSVQYIGSYFTAAENHRSVHLRGSVGVVSQALVTVPGVRYRVQFAMAGHPDKDQGVKTLRVSAAESHADFTFDTTGRSIDDMGWKTKTWEFVAQDTTTLLKFETRTPGTYYGPAIDNVVVQPLEHEDVRVYLDLDHDGEFQPEEPLTFLRPDDPNTPDVDETGAYRFTGLPAGTYQVRELLADGFEQIVPAEPDFYTVTLAADETATGLDFVNTWNGVISGTKFLDLNGNGVRDRNPLPVGDAPTVLLVVDVSNTCNRYAGFSVEDQNGHSGANNVLDAEIFAMLQVQQELVTLGWGDTARVGLVVFASDGVALDLDPAASGTQLYTTPNADADADGVTDLEQVLRSLRPVQSGTGSRDTDYEAALQTSLATLAAAQPAGDVAMFFTSDGLANNPWNLDDELAALDALGVVRTAWGFGDICDVGGLRRIDPYAEQLHSTAEIYDRATARSRSGVGDGLWVEPGLAGVTIYLDANRNNLLDPGETTVVTRDDDPVTDVDETGWYEFEDLAIGTYRVREIVPDGYVQTAPLQPDWYEVDLRTGPIASGYDFGNILPGSIRGCKGSDLDGDGVIGPDESGLSGVTIYIDLNDNGVYEPELGEPSYVTDADMDVEFDAHWRFDEGEGTSVNDSSPSGRNNPGELVGNPVWTDEGYNGALQFDGINDAVWIFDSADINYTTSNTRSISVWFQVDDPSISDRKQVLYEEGGAINGLNLYLYDGQFYGGQWVGGTGLASFLTAAAPSPGQWTHASLVLDMDATNPAETLRLYVNGVLVASSEAEQLPGHPADIGIGAVQDDTEFHDGNYSGDGHYFAGLIGDVRVYNRALTDAEIEALARVPDAPETGIFAFDSLSPGEYVIREVVPDGYEQTWPDDGRHVVSVAEGEHVTGLTFANLDLRGCIPGLKWIDFNANDVRDDGEPGQANVTIYVDLDDDGQRDKDEPYAITDENGEWTIPDLAPGTYVVREELPVGYDFGYPGEAGHVVEVLAGQVTPLLLFANIPLALDFGGFKFQDYDADGCRDRNDLHGNQPLLVFTIDVSDSTYNSYDGQPVGDQNGDGFSDTVLDLQIAGLKAINQAIIDSGIDDTVDIAIVAFGDSGQAIDMNPATTEIDLITSPSADQNGNGTRDVDEVLSGLQINQFGPNTKYDEALLTVRDVIQDLGRSGNESNVLFLSDGEPDNQDNYADDVSTLQGMGVTLSAFGTGYAATIHTLQIIDSTAIAYGNPAEMVAAFSIPSPGSPGTSPLPGSSDGRWIEPGVAGVVIYLDTNNNGQLDWADADGDGEWDAGEGERWTVTEEDDPATPDFDETGRYQFTDLEPGTYIVREIVPDGWVQIAPSCGLGDDVVFVDGAYIVELAYGRVPASLNFANHCGFFGDYDGSGTVDDADYDFWKSSFGQSVTPWSGADGSGNGTVDAADYCVWRDNFHPAPLLPGDYDRDGTVEEADYMLWKAPFGQTVTLYSSADGNGDGSVDAADYCVWRDNLGATAAAGATAMTTSAPLAVESVSAASASLQVDVAVEETTIVTSVPTAGASIYDTPVAFLAAPTSDTSRSAATRPRPLRHSTRLGDATIEASYRDAALLRLTRDYHGRGDTDDAAPAWHDQQEDKPDDTAATTDAALAEVGQDGATSRLLAWPSPDLPTSPNERIWVDGAAAVLE